MLQQPKREEHALVLDYLPSGKPSEAKKEPIAQVMGDQFFTLLEVTIKPGTTVSVGDKMYIGKGERDKAEFIRGRIVYTQLTSSAQREAEDQVRKIVAQREQDLVHFLNNAGSLNIRSHALELLPSIGKKHLAELLNAREKQKFTSFEDVQQRVPSLGKVAELFVQRIMEELHGESKYYLFVKQPRREDF